MRRGRPPYPDILTPRQWEVLELVREGLSNGEIARELGISTDGAKFHVSEILTKLGVPTRREAAEWDGQPAVQESVEQEAGKPTARLTVVFDDRRRSRTNMLQWPIPRRLARGAETPDRIIQFPVPVEGAGRIAEAA